MKAFLTSHFLEEKHFEKFKELLGKQKADKALFITAASVPYGLNPKPMWLTESLKDMSKLTKKFDETSLEDGKYLPENLNQYDFIFISGGNSFYLSYRLAKTDLGNKIKQYIENGGLYSGSSAGAIILMDSIEPFASVDDPSQSPELSPALGVIDFAIIPHTDNEKYSDPMEKIASDFKKNNKEVFLLNDNQVLIINGENKEVI